MSTFFELCCFILLVILSLIGMVGNGFIATIYFIDWFRSRKLSPADMILSCLGLFRFASHAFGIQSVILSLYFKDIYEIRTVYIALGGSWLFTYTANLWFAAWLSVLYCVKIANFSHPVFLQMKQRFPGLVPRLLLGTVVLSAITATVGAIMGSTRVFECTSNSHKSLPSNNTDLGIKASDFCKYSVLLYVVPAFFPFLIFFPSSILVLIFLWRHKNLLQNTARDVSTEVHLNAIKALAFFSIFYVVCFFVQEMAVFFFWNGVNNVGVHLSFTNVNAAYSSGHAIILIFINPKLKQESVKMLHQLKC